MSTHQVKGPPLLAQSLTVPNYKTEYQQRFDGRHESLKYSRVPTAFKAWKYVAKRPETCHAFNAPPHMSSSQNLYARHIPTSESVRDYKRSLLSNQGYRPSAERRSYNDLYKIHDRHTADAGFRLNRSETQRPNSEASRYHQALPYLGSHCFFHPANEPMRRYFVIDKNWPSEHKQYNIRKNNLFA